MDTTEIPVIVKKSKKQESMDMAYYTVYRYRGIPYIPHYSKPDCYVGVDNVKDSGMKDRSDNRFFVDDHDKEFTAKELERAGATKEPMYLWHRYKYVALK